MYLYYLFFLSLIIIVSYLIFRLTNKKNYFVSESNIEILNNQEEYNLYTNVDHYRFGDVYHGYSVGSGTSCIYKDHVERFPNSIASEYIIKSGKTPLNKELLINILKNRSKESENTTDTCIVHLRVGDVLDLAEYNNTFHKILDKYYNDKTTTTNSYLYSKSYYLDKIKILKKLNIKNIIIISGSHVDCGNYKYSTFYINKIKKLFENNGFNIKLKLASHPDSDIMLVYNSKYFIGSKGGYSKVLEEIVLSNNNTVL